MSTEFSLLRSACVRELPIALAHAMVTQWRRDISDERMLLLNRLFSRLTIGDKIRCQREIRECRAAKRGERLAIIA